VAGQLRLLLAGVREPAPRSGPPATEAAAPAVRRPAAAAKPAPPLPRPAAGRAPLVLGVVAPADAPDAETTDASALPKPRALPPIENPLRRRDRDDAPPRSEEEILAALSALAASRGR
jgi:hypothetical protein